MAKSRKLERKPETQCHGIGLHKLSSRCTKICGDANHEGSQAKASERKEWEDAVCSVCMEFPHNAVLLLCSSYDKGCRPFMCATSHRFSNCLKQYKKAYTKAPPKKTTANDPIFDDSGLLTAKPRAQELLCPLCRCAVKGWTIVEPARLFFNAKKRSCMQENCSFAGTYKQLRKHVKLEHPLARPRAVDPSHAEKWKKLENERDLSDVFSTIRSTMPGAIIIGDYVIERAGHNFAMDYNDGRYFQLPVRNRRNGQRFSPDLADEEDSEPLFDEAFRSHHRARGSSSSSRRHGSNAAPSASRRPSYSVARRASRFRAGR